MNCFKEELNRIKTCCSYTLEYCLVPANYRHSAKRYAVYLIPCISTKLLHMAYFAARYK